MDLLLDLVQQYHSNNLETYNLKNQEDFGLPGFFYFKSCYIFFMNFKFFLLIFALFFFTSCGSPKNDIQKNLAELDKVYGKCNNPARQFTRAERKICEDKLRAAGPDGEIGEPIDLLEIAKNFRNRGTPGGSFVMSNVNQHLWQGSLALLEKYTIKNIDYNGGFIETEWIYKEQTPNDRCAIKANILSGELISTGIKIKINCEKKIDNQWYQNNLQFTDEEKRLTLQVLKIANELNNIQSTS